MGLRSGLRLQVCYGYRVRGRGTCRDKIRSKGRGKCMGRFTLHIEVRSKGRVMGKITVRSRVRSRVRVICGGVNIPKIFINLLLSVTSKKEYSPSWTGVTV